MSHFMVMVVGDDVEEALAPYHEYECTGIKDKYVVPVDRTKEVQDLLAEESEELDECLIEAGVQGGIYKTEEEALAADEKWGYCVFSDGKVQKAVEFTNPNKKWDWWVIGGRYKDHLLLKDGTRVSSAKKKDIDFEGMEASVWEQAARSYDEVYGWVPAEELDQLRSLSEDELRKLVRDDVLPGPLRGVSMDLCGTHSFRQYHYNDVKRLLTMSREEYSDTIAKIVWMPFTLVDDKGWFSRGDMGWFGMYEEGPLQYEEYIKQVSDRISSLPDDTMITVVDCHI